MPKICDVILSIETSCDDTSLAILCVKTGTVILHEHVSQISHSKFGGVVPEIASREHTILLQKLFDNILKKINVQSIVAVGVTKGPGLIGSLLCGVSFAKGLAISLNVPLIGVNHLHGHIMSASFTKKLKYPLLCLLISGGHSQIVRINTFEDYELITESLDDAIGEVFDKVAKYFDLGYPGGPIIEQLANKAEREFLLKMNFIEDYNFFNQHEMFYVEDKKFLKSFYENFFYKINNFSFKTPIEDSNRIDLSFSGLKTQVKNFIQEKKNNNELNDCLINRICYEFQKTVIKLLINKLFIILKDFLKDTKAIKARKQIIVCGGVASNKKLKDALFFIANAFRVELIFPPTQFTTDNAAMIGKMAIEKYKRSLFDNIDMKINNKLKISEL